MNRCLQYLRDPDRGRHLLDGLFPILFRIFLAVGGSAIGVASSGVPLHPDGDGGAAAPPIVTSSAALPQARVEATADLGHDPGEMRDEFAYGEVAARPGRQHPTRASP